MCLGFTFQIFSSTYTFQTVICRISFIRFTSSGFCLREIEMNETKTSSEVEADGFQGRNILVVPSEIFLADC